MKAKISETATRGATLSGGWIEQVLIDQREDAGRAPARIGALMQQLTLRRVGGEFWAPPVNWGPRVRIAVRAEDRQSFEDRLAFADKLGDADEIGLLLPLRRWARSLSASLSKRGYGLALGAADPWAVLASADTLVVGGDDELALLGLIAGVTVHCRSGGVFAGWGVTQDAAAIAQRGQRQVWQLAAAALVDGVRYSDPFSGGMTTSEAIVDILGDWRRIIDEDRDLSCLAGVAMWKRGQIRRLVAPLGPKPAFYQEAKSCVARAKREGGAIAVWPSRAPRGLEVRAKAADVPLRRVEDGFVRSVGLGSDLLPPSSIVVDRRGIYYDPSRPSDVELILSQEEFAPALKERAQRLITTLVTRRLTKYNTGGDDYVRPAKRRVVLVPGQVEDDQSWKLGGGDCTGNLDLLRRVRHREPDAFILYKPHPDVEAGNRVGAVPDSEALRFADQIVRDVATPALLAHVDAVHVLTSLTGFEALLRGREVVVHGQPFYCGWGLTCDLSPPQRRGRRLDLSELVAGALILYPRYLDPATGLICPPEVLLERLVASRAKGLRAAPTVRRLRQSATRVINLLAHTPLLHVRAGHD